MPKLINAVQAADVDNVEEVYVSEAVYWEQYYEAADVSYEWNDGRLEEKPVSYYWISQTYFLTPTLQRWSQKLVLLE